MRLTTITACAILAFIVYFSTSSNQVQALKKLRKMAALAFILKAHQKHLDNTMHQEHLHENSEPKKEKKPIKIIVHHEKPKDKHHHHHYTKIVKVPVPHGSSYKSPMYGPKPHSHKDYDVEHIDLYSDGHHHHEHEPMKHHESKHHGQKHYEVHHFGPSSHGHHHHHDFDDMMKHQSTANVEIFDESELYGHHFHDADDILEKGW